MAVAAPAVANLHNDISFQRRQCDREQSSAAADRGLQPATVFATPSSDSIRPV